MVYEIELGIHCDYIKKLIKSIKISIKYNLYFFVGKYCFIFESNCYDRFSNISLNCIRILYKTDRRGGRSVFVYMLFWIIY